MQPTGHISIVILRKQSVKSWKFWSFIENVSGKIYIISIFVRFQKYNFKLTHSNTFMQNTKETNESNKQEKGKWELRISAAVFADFPVLVA